MKFTIEGRLPGLNEIIAATNSHRFAGASQKKKETRRCAMEVIRQTSGRISNPVRVAITWVDPDARRDPDNVIAGQKFIFDGLVECGRLPGDSRKWIKEITHSF